MRILLEEVQGALVVLEEYDDVECLVQLVNVLFIPVPRAEGQPLDYLLRQLTTDIVGIIAHLNIVQ